MSWRRNGKEKDNIIEEESETFGNGKGKTMYNKGVILRI